MKLLLVSLLVAYAAADVSHILPGAQGRDAQILKQEQDIGPDGKYQFVYDTQNGISHHEHGELKNPGSENEFQHKEGSYVYTAPDGQVIKVEYEADANGFHPKGDILPVGPPIPEAILRSLEYIRTHAPAQK